MMFSRNLTLEKTHDFCSSSSPKLAVVMIHGIASDSTAFDHALKFLEEASSLKDVRFVTFDLLGSGKSRTDDELNYDYADQLEALHNAIAKLKLHEPMVLVGHSLGTFIVTRYTATYPDEVGRLILVSPPIYTERDFDNPAFPVAIDAFKKAVSVKRPHIKEKKSFVNSMEKIVLDRKNYNYLVKLKTPTTLIYGNEDKIIASYNIPGILKQNNNITAIRTVGRHGVTHDKYSKMIKLIEEALNAETI